MPSVSPTVQPSDEPTATPSDAPVLQPTAGPIPSCTNFIVSRTACDEFTDLDVVFIVDSSSSMRYKV